MNIACSSAGSDDRSLWITSLNRHVNVELFFAGIVVRRGPSMRKVYGNSFASKAVVAKLIKLGYLNDGPILTNTTVRFALERLRTDLCQNATIQARIQRQDGSSQ
jgi:hypothetical protein